MKLMKSILCGVVCFAFACLIGTSCSKKAAEEQQAKTVITLEVTAPQAQQTEAVDNAFAVVRARIERYGISNMTMQKMDNGRIQIDLPGVQDIKRLEHLLQNSANLEFWETYTLEEIGSYEALQPLFGLFETFGDRYSPVIGTANVADTAKINETLNQIARDLPRDARFAWEVKPVDETGQYFRLIALRASNRRGPALEGDAITDARAEESGYYNGNGEVILKMNASGARRWEEITMRNIGKNIAIVLDGEVYSYPMVQSAITGGICSITGNFTMEEAKDLANTLKSGKMSAPIRVIYMEVIEPAQ